MVILPQGFPFYFNTDNFTSATTSEQFSGSLKLFAINVNYVF